MIELDVTQTNQAIDRLPERTENPRHRFLLLAVGDLTPAGARELLDPHIAPLPSFDEAVPDAEP